MKKIILLAFTALFVSCTSIDEEPKSNLTTGQFYKTEDDAIAAVNAVYHRMFTEWLVLYNRQLMMLEMATDDINAGPRTRSTQVIDMSRLNYVPNNSALNWTWQYTYDAINRANIAIDRISAMDEGAINPELRERLINEARFLRGWNYFNLVRWFGEVPLVLHETKSLSPAAIYVSQASEEEIYAQVIEDLTAAEALPPAGSYPANEVGRATTGAAKTLLAKVYLTRQQWQLAADKAYEIISSGTYGLYQNYADVFNVATKNGTEHIFSLQYNGSSTVTNGLAWYSLPFEINGEYVDTPNPQGGLYESYEPGDVRRDLTFADQIVNPQTGELITLANRAFIKYFDGNNLSAPRYSAKNVPLLRYSDVLLIYAEALNELDGATPTAYQYLDAVRLRAQVAPLSEIEPGLSKQDFRERVFSERRKELVLEYHRWFDLSRRGADVYVQTLHAAGKPNAAPRHVKFPIPQRELQLNPNLHQSAEWIGY